MDYLEINMLSHIADAVPQKNTHAVQNGKGPASEKGGGAFGLSCNQEKHILFIKTLEGFVRVLAAQFPLGIIHPEVDRNALIHEVIGA